MCEDFGLDRDKSNKKIIDSAKRKIADLQLKEHAETAEPTMILKIKPKSKIVAKNVKRRG
jgi:predicted sulfurtransferase